MTGVVTLIGAHGDSRDMTRDYSRIAKAPQAARLRLALILAGLWLLFMWLLAMTLRDAPADALALPGLGSAALVAAVYVTCTRHCRAPIHQSEALLHLLADLTDSREHAVYGHSWRVGAYSRALAVALGLRGEAADRVGYAGLLHDIGKIGVPDGLLNKTGPLDAEERALMMGHAAAGARVVLRAGPLRALAPLIRHHHEWWSGEGYPEGLAREAIPLGARILGVADAFDTMTTDRPYRPRRSREAALAEFRRSAGEQFDPRVVAALEELVGAEAETSGEGFLSRPTLVEQARAEG
jgi:HD-GYP domain-containing protein (c-di-GMP phosphodiesterase class II)